MLKGIVEFRNPGNTIVAQIYKAERVFYERLIEYKKYFKECYFFTFDKKNLEEFNIKYRDNILYNKFNLHSVLYAFLAPFLYRKIFKSSKYFFAIQIPSSLYPLYCSFFFKNIKIIVFWNYDWIKMAEITEKKKIYIFFIKVWTYITLKFIKYYVVTNQADKEIILKKQKNAKIIILPSPINLDIFKPLNYKRKKRSLIFVGRITFQKNLKNLILAVSEIKDIELNIIGEGELKEELKNLSMSLKLNINFLGQKQNYEIVELLNVNSIFILPSYMEGISNALVESMACKTPVIASNIYTTRQIIIDKVTGILCETSKDSIKSAIEYAFQNPEKIKEYAENAYQFAKENFSIEKYFKKISDFVTSE